MAARVHVIGAGLAGLSAATILAGAGYAVSLYEAGPAAGGRCRSYHDRTLDLLIDNGNHLLLSGNRDVFDFRARIGAEDRPGAALAGPEAAAFPFLDLASGARWILRPSAGRLPLWAFSAARRVPGSRARDYLALAKLATVRDDRSVADLFATHPLYRRLIAPLAIAVLNTPPEEALARLLGAVLRETLARGGRAAIPRFPAHGLSAALIDPALAWLAARGAAMAYGRRIAGLTLSGGRVSGLEGPGGAVALAPADWVLLAVPAPVAGGLLPGLVVPDEFQAIVNLHFAATADLGPAGFLGLLGGTAEWVFAKDGHLSVTISAANRLNEADPEALAADVWSDLSRALALPAAMPACRLVRERRATFAATAAQEARRPGPRVGPANLLLAGDWTATGLPATIEGAIRSGRVAASLVRKDAP